MRHSKPQRPTSRLKRKITIITVAFVMGITAFTVRGLTKSKSKATPTQAPSGFFDNLAQTDFSLTHKECFGDDGVYFFSNLYFSSNHFLIAQEEKSKSLDNTLLFRPQTEYNYDVLPLSHSSYNEYTKTKNSYKIPGTTLFLASSKGMKSLQPHYFHFLEEFILGWSAYRELRGKTMTTVVFPDIEHWEGLNNINAQILQALIPNVTILNKSQFKNLSNKHLLQFENAILVDRLSCHNLKEVQTYNKMSIGHAALIKSDYLKEIRDSVLSSLKTYDKSNRKPTITYIHRKNRRYLEPKFEEKFLTALKTSFPDYKIQPVWFEKLNYAAQLQVIRNTDVLIGAHGNGLTHSYFLPDHALVLEIFPEGAFAMDYQLISEFAGHEYYAIEPAQGIISHAGHHMPPRGNVNQVIPEFNINWILDSIKKHFYTEGDLGCTKEISPSVQPLIKD